MQVFTDRSRIITAQRCLRRRFYEYHQNEIGIRSAKMPLPLAVGGSVHAGLARLLQWAMNSTVWPWELVTNQRDIEDDAVRVALADFSQYTAALELDAGESSEFESARKRVEGDEQLETMMQDGIARYDRYLVAEQTALVEAMVRAYARRRLRPLLEQYEVLEVEREGTWTLAEGGPTDNANAWGKKSEILFMSRPDALLLDRQSRQLYLLSYKTTGRWDSRKAKDIEHDMQGLSEGIEIERRLAEWWDIIHNETDAAHLWPEPVGDFLRTCDSPPRILGIRYEFLHKGERWTDKDLAAEIGIAVRAQRSHLIRGYLNQGMAAGDEQWNWSWEYLKPGGEQSKLYFKNWKSAPVWEHMTIKTWIDLLDSTSELIIADADSGGMDVRNVGWSSSAQSTGTTATHPLDDAFVPPIVVHRNEDDLRDLIEQMEASEVQIAQRVAEVQAAADEAEVRHLLNIYFPQSRGSCSYPSECPYVKICFGGQEIRRDPLGSGLFILREANHPQERIVDADPGVS